MEVQLTQSHGILSHHFIWDQEFISVEHLNNQIKILEDEILALKEENHWLTHSCSTKCINKHPRMGDGKYHDEICKLRKKKEEELCICKNGLRYQPPEDILNEAKRDHEGEIRMIHQNYYAMHPHHCERDGQM